MAGGAGRPVVIGRDRHTLFRLRTLRAGSLLLPRKREKDFTL